MTGINSKENDMKGLAFVIAVLSAIAFAFNYENTAAAAAWAVAFTGWINIALAKE